LPGLSDERAGLRAWVRLAVMDVTRADRLTVHSLVPGRTYRIAKAFRDYTGSELSTGDELTYVEQHFLPYDGGYTIVFARGDGVQRSLYLQEEKQGDILEDFDAYFVDRSAAT